jgi:hypothetical protein
MYVPKFTITDEQVTYAKTALAKSLGVPFSNYWDLENEKANTEKLRFFGFLGEVAFADAYKLPRPSDCYGFNGQDKGSDFILCGAHIDIKTAPLKVRPKHAEYFTFMPSVRIIDKVDSITDNYFFVGIYEERGVYTCYFAGSALAKDLKNRKIGKEHRKGEILNFSTKSYTIQTDCIRLNATQIKPVKITELLLGLPNFEIYKLD